MISPGQVLHVDMTHIPLPRELVQVAKRPRDCIVGKVGLVLLHEPAACLGVVGFGDGVLQVSLFYRIQRDNNTVYLGERVVQVALSIRRR
jgi:hypothetical protein